MIDKFIKFWHIFWRGMCMGLADLVPGVSGGTLALLLGIYERFLASLSGFTSFDYRLFLQINKFKYNFLLFWRKIDGLFLSILLSGIFTAILLFANLLKYLLENDEVMLLAFFFGLMLATLVVLLKQLNFAKYSSWLIFVIGVLFAFSINYLPFKLGYSLIDFYLAGLIASCFMLLPGVSGSFMLLLLGLYPDVINAIHYFNLKILIIFALGVATGFLFFSRILHNFLNKKYQPTMALLTGFIAGSLPNLWPWQAIKVYTIIDGNIKIIKKELLTPFAYDYILGNNYLFFVILLVILGFLLTLYLNKLGAKNEI